MNDALVKPKNGLINESGVHDYFVASNRITPLTPIGIDEIANIDVTSNDSVLSEKQVEHVIKQDTPTYFSKFFNRLEKYVDNIENFLASISNLELKKIDQKKILLETEKSEQIQRNYRAKKLLRTNKLKEEKEEEPIDLQKNPELGSILAAALGMTAAGAIFSPPTGTAEIYDEVVGEGGFGVEQGQNVTRPPAWIPFPKGTGGLVYTSGYGMRVSPTSGRYKMHSGIDIAGPTGAPIITPISGIVSFAGDEGDGYGFKVVITSGQLKMLFGHMNRQPSVATNQQVRAGTVIGGIGSTGQSTGPHLHWNVYVNGSTVNPVDWTYTNRPQTGTTSFNVKNETSPLDKESEGGINSARRIMVGEAGKEFVVPLAQMPLFVQAMLEEKVKSLNPMYEVSGGFSGDFGLQTVSGTAKTKFASGGITGGSPEFWQMVAISATEDILHPQGQADVAQSIYNRIAVGSYPGGKNITRIITADGQYQPTFKNPGQWNAIKDRKSAITATKILPYVGKNAPALVDSAARAITNPNLQREAARFVGGRTDFMGESQKGSMKPNDITRGKNHNYFGWFYDARLPKAAPIHSSVKSMSKPISVPQAPKVKQENWYQKFIKFITPKNQTAYLNQIDDMTQSEVANSYSDQFDYQKMTHEIVAFYQPTIYYSES